MRRFELFLTVLICFVLSSCVKEPQSKAGLLPIPETVAQFRVSYKEGWHKTLAVLALEYGFALDVKDPSMGLIVTGWESDRYSPAPTRFRLNLKVSGTDDETVITAFRQTKIMQNGLWRSIPSDGRLERELLEKIAARLKTTNQMAPDKFTAAPPSPSLSK